VAYEEVEIRRDCPGQLKSSSTRVYRRDTSRLYLLELPFNVWNRRAV
jgi:hypothetical protein